MSVAITCHMFWSWKTRVSGVVLLARKVIPTENRAIGRVSFPPGQQGYLSKRQGHFQRAAGYTPGFL